MKILSYFNLRTFLAIAISQLAAFLTLHFQIKLHLDLLLFGLCVVFPLHFSLQAAFKRREKALEYFSFFKGRCLAAHYTFELSKDLADDRKLFARNLLRELGAQLMTQLENRISGFRSIQQKIDALMAFTQDNREEISSRSVIRLIRYLSDVSDSASYLISLVSHRTMLGMRFYGIFFGLILPFVQAPLLLHRLDGVIPVWAFHLMLALTSLILVTLLNFQQMIEYPFDPRGVDNINIREFSLEE